jgi:hypothetical protein
MSRFNQREPITERQYVPVGDRTVGGVYTFGPSAQRKGQGSMNTKTKELVLIALLASLALALAWYFEQDFFAIFFAAAAAIALGEAFRRSL